MGKKTSVALLTGVAGLGFVMMGCPPAEQPPPAGERIVEPAPMPTDPTMPPPRDPTMPPPGDMTPPPPPQDYPQDPPPLDPEEPTDPLPPPGGG
jgi:hypothetical protein